MSASLTTQLTSHKFSDKKPPAFWNEIEGDFEYRNRYAGSDKDEDVRFVVAMLRFAAAEKHGTSMRLARVAVENVSK